MAESRTKKSVINSGVALLMYFINLVLQFFSRKIFLEYLGTEILGLNTTATNLLQFLNLAELGIGQAIAFSLYSPLFKGDFEEISEVMAVQKWLYRRIAWMIIGAALILMGFFPLIFDKMQLPLWYAYASFGVLLFSSLLGYFVNYKQVLFSADQKDYMVLASMKSVTFIKVVCQIFAVAYAANGYLWWLILEALFAIISSASISYAIKRSYPLLHNCKMTYADLKQKYSIIVTKIKQLFFHKIGSFVMTQTSPVIIYAFTTLTVVALYGNYMLVINGFLWLVMAMSSSMAGGIGNLIASESEEKVIKVYNELFSIRFTLIFSLALVIYYITPGFIRTWIGTEYLLDNVTLLFMIGIFVVSTINLTTDAFVYGYGLFSDIWAPIAEGVVNIGLSVWFGSIYGLSGIVGAVFISLVLSKLIWKPYYLYSRKLPGRYKGYLLEFGKHMLAGGIVALIIWYLKSRIELPEITGYIGLAIYACAIFVISFGLIYGIQYLLGTGIRDFGGRFRRMIGR